MRISVLGAIENADPSGFGLFTPFWSINDGGYSSDSLAIAQVKGEAEQQGERQGSRIGETIAGEGENGHILRIITVDIQHIVCKQI